MSSAKEILKTGSPASTRGRASRPASGPRTWRASTIGGYRGAPSARPSPRARGLPATTRARSDEGSHALDRVRAAPRKDHFTKYSAKCEGRLRGCADRLATFHTCSYSERSNGLLIAHWHIRYPPIRASSNPKMKDGPPHLPTNRVCWRAYCCQTTNTHELRFRAMLTENGIRRVEFARDERKEADAGRSSRI